ncbi:MAG: AI-2E family transporter [Myxococcota bacterium]
MDPITRTDPAPAPTVPASPTADPTAPPPVDPWSQRTKDLWFFGALAASAIGVLYLLSTFLYVLLFACVVVVVTWPLYQRLLVAYRGRSLLASISTAAILLLVVFGPLSFFGYLFVQEAIAMVGVAADFIRRGELVRWVDYLTTSVDWMPVWLQSWLPDDFDMQQTIAGPLQDGALNALNTVGTMIPGLVGTTMTLGIDAVIFVASVVTMYMEGPRLLRVVKNLSPMDDSYEERLFAVFGEFANNLVLGSLVTAAVQGTVAGVGYAIAGVDRVVFFAMLTGICAFVPVVGTLLIWIPLALLTGSTYGLQWGIFLAVWGIGVAQLDNIIRPLFMRGRTNIHPLLIFLAVFGGIAWLNLPGALLGPVMVAGFLALYTIYAEDYLKQPPPITPSQDEARMPTRVQRWMAAARRLLERLGVRKVGPAEARRDATEAAVDRR